jgi:uncharacterized delta-60 repeat protein
MSTHFGLRVLRVAAFAAVAVIASLVLDLSSALRADDGDADPGFGSGGLAVPGPGVAGAVVVRGDGSLRVGVDRGNDVAVLALRANGTVDTSFGVNGWRIVTPYPGGGNDDDTLGLFERPNGKLLLAVEAEDGEATRRVLVQLTAGGSLDPGFGTGGIRVLSSLPDTFAYDAAMQSDGKVVLAGICLGCEESGVSDSFVARYLADGAVDPDFGDDGWKIFDADEVGHGYDFARVVTLDTSGRILVGGLADLDDPRAWVGRLQSDGDLDGAFSGNGLQTLLEVSSQSVTALAVEPVKKTIFVATSAALPPYPVPGSSTALARLTQGGGIDSGWSGDGYYPLDLEEGTTISQILVQSDGRIVAAGTMNSNGAPWTGFFLARFFSAGVLDPSFDGNGLKRIEFDLEADGHDYVRAAALAGGRIVAVGGAASAAGYQVAALRTQSALVFEDGFERGSVTGWTE